MDDNLGIEYALKAYQALRTKERVLTLIGIREGMTLKEVSESLDMSYSGVYTYAEDLEDAYLVENRNGNREITPVGKTALAKTRVLNDRLKTKAEKMEKEKERKLTENRDLTSITKDEIDRLREDEDS